MRIWKQGTTTLLVSLVILFTQARGQAEPLSGQTVYLTTRGSSAEQIVKAGKADHLGITNPTKLILETQDVTGKVTSRCAFVSGNLIQETQSRPGIFGLGNLNSTLTINNQTLQLARGYQALLTEVRNNNPELIDADGHIQISKLRQTHSGMIGWVDYYEQAMRSLCHRDVQFPTAP